MEQQRSGSLCKDIIPESTLLASTAAIPKRSVEKPDDLARHVFPPRLLVIHNPGRGGENDIPELSRRQQSDDPLLEIA